jgi:hypothetical protein|tara:strand:+ start:455 stop:658 length:204 start_codon:yes stop_codon:yes gene_type:complete
MVTNWSQLNDKVKSCIKLVKDAESPDEKFIDLASEAMSEITLKIGDKGIMLFDKDLAREIINAEIKK